MPAYWLARALINEPVAYKRYADQVPDILAKFGAKFWRVVENFRSWKARTGSSALL